MPDPGPIDPDLGEPAARTPTQPPNKPPFAPPPGTPYGGPPLDTEWVPPPGTVYAGPEPTTPGGRPRKDRNAWPAKAPPVPAADPDADGGDKGSRAVALLLGVAALLAALVTARASLVSSDATSAWQSSVSQEQKRGANLLEDARYVLGVEGDLAFIVTTADVTAQALRAVMPGASPAVAARLDAEAQVQEQVVGLIGPSQELVAAPSYRLPDGGYDLQQRLADNRATYPDILALDPVAQVEAGDRAADQAIRLLTVTVVIAFAFLFGALGQAVKRRRRILLALGWGCLAVATVAALAAGLVP